MLISSGRSLTNRAKSKGDNRLPSGVPDKTGVHSEHFPLTTTLCFRFVRKDDNQFKALSDIWYEWRSL